MSTTSKEQQYDVLVKALFELLDTVEQTDTGQNFRPTVIRSCRTDHVEKLDKIMIGLKNMLKEKQNDLALPANAAHRVRW